jgi:hypothetical protein
VTIVNYPKFDDRFFNSVSLRELVVGKRRKRILRDIELYRIGIVELGWYDRGRLQVIFAVGWPWLARSGI